MVCSGSHAVYTKVNRRQAEPLLDIYGDLQVCGVFLMFGLGTIF